MGAGLTVVMGHLQLVMPAVLPDGISNNAAMSSSNSDAGSDASLLDRVTVKPVKAGFRANPQETAFVAVNSLDMSVGKVLMGIDMNKPALLPE